MAAEPLTAPGDWQALVDVATGRQADPADAHREESAARWRPVLNTGAHDLPRQINAHVDRIRDRGLVTVTGEGRRRLTDADRAHYAAHHADYARRWPDITAPAPADLDTDPGARDETAEPVTETVPDAEARERERRQFEARLKPIPEIGQGYQAAEWPGTGRYHLVHAGERIGYAEKRPFSRSRWQAPTTQGSTVPGTGTYSTRRQALIEVALHHRHLAASAQPKRRGRQHSRRHWRGLLTVPTPASDRRSPWRRPCGGRGVHGPCPGSRTPGTGTSVGAPAGR